MKRLLFILNYATLLVALQISLPAAAYAQNTAFKQRILPLDCVFETVDAGTGLLYYVTPAACGVVVALPAPPNIGTTSPGNPLVAKVIGPIPQGSVAIVPGSQSRQILLPGGWRPIASLTANNQPQIAGGATDSWVAAIVAVSLMAVAFVIGRLLL
ncbi:MAG TPA: hypothetical protein VFI84_00105 [Candidatus Saccharimonadales bacterium]|nr:hypothetical protein [Candidatus Saccharimonadales bacterium]